MKKILILLSLTILFNCQTTKPLNTFESSKIKIENENNDNLQDSPEPDKDIVYKEKIVVVTKPLYLPITEKDKYESKNLTGDDAVKASMEDAEVNPDYWSGGMMIYDFDPTFMFKIYSKPTAITDIELEPGEIVIGDLVWADTTRWEIGAGISENYGIKIQHIYIKPVQAGLETSLIINTNKRRYYLILLSYSDKFMMAVKWNYPNNDMPQDFAIASSNSIISNSILGLNPADLNFDNYKVEYSQENLYFMPKTVFDDNKSRTYIVFDQSIANYSMPVPHQKNGDLLNYTVQGNIMIISKLITNITLKVENLSLSIIKKEKK